MKVFFQQNKVRLILYTAGICLALALSIGLTHIRDYRSSDYFLYWVSSRILLMGQDPYNTGQWSAGVHAFGPQSIFETALTYPLWLAISFIPFGALPVQLAAGIWIFLTASFIMVSLCLLFSSFNKYQLKLIAIPVLAGIVLFRPLLITFFMGQLAGLLLFVVTMSVYLFSKGKWEIGAALLPIVLLKPQIGAPLMSLISLWLLVKHKWIALLCEAAIASIIIGSAFLVDLGWVPKWLGVGANTLSLVFGQSPTLWGFAMFVCSGKIACGLSLGSVLSTASLTLCVILILYKSEMEPETVFSLIICTALLVTPYLLAMDQLLLLLPILISIKKQSEKDSPFLITSTLMLLISALAIGVVPLTIRLRSDSLSAVVTLFAFAIFGLSLITSKTRNLWRIGSAKIVS